MKDIRIQLNAAQDIMRFNRILTKYDCDFDLEVGRSYVDAKSLLGIYSLSLQKPMTLHIQADEEMTGEVIDELRDFVYEESLV